MRKQTKVPLTIRERAARLMQVHRGGFKLLHQMVVVRLLIIVSTKAFVFPAMSAMKLFYKAYCPARVKPGRRL